LRNPGFDASLKDAAPHVNRSRNPAFIPLIVFPNIYQNRGGGYVLKRSEPVDTDFSDASLGVFHEGLKIGASASRPDGRRYGL
jgi:hypothetical protein